MKHWEKELYLYRMTPVPPKKDNFQDYIDLYFENNDETYFLWFMHYYEPVINTKIIGQIQSSGMNGHFIDMKQTFVTGLYKALKRYDISKGVPFLIFKENYVKREIDNYIRTMQTGYSVQSENAYATLKKAMALYNKYECNNDDETIEKISAEIDKSISETRELIQCGIRNMSYSDFYKYFDDEETPDDVTKDSSSDPCHIVCKMETADEIFGEFEKLEYREKSIISEHLAFCPECYSDYEMIDDNGIKKKKKRTPKPFYDIAIDNMLSSPDTAFKIYNKSLNKMKAGICKKNPVTIMTTG